MNDLQIFKNDEFGEVRTIVINEQPFLMLKDVCSILGLTNSSKVKERLKEDGVTTSYVIDRLGRKQEAKFINESNLYRLIFQSRKPEAEKFSDWVTSEVLPAIRKTGKYELVPSPDVMADDEFLDVTKLEMDQRIRIAGIIASCRRERLPLVAKVLSLDLDDLKIPSLTSEANSAAIEYIDSAWDSFDTTIPIRVFHANYVNWCKENDIVPLTKNKLTAVLKKFYPIVTSMSSYSVNGKMVFRNVRVYRKTRKQLREGEVR